MICIQAKLTLQGTMTVAEPFKSKHKKARDSDGNKWYMINYNGRSGWVRSKYCVKDRI